MDKLFTVPISKEEANAMAALFGWYVCSSVITPKSNPQEQLLFITDSKLFGKLENAENFILLTEFEIERVFVLVHNLTFLFLLEPQEDVKTTCINLADCDTFMMCCRYAVKGDKENFSPFTIMRDNCDPLTLTVLEMSRLIAIINVMETSTGDSNIEGLKIQLIKQVTSSQIIAFNKIGTDMLYALAKAYIAGLNQMEKQFQVFGIELKSIKIDRKLLRKLDLT